MNQMIEKLEQLAQLLTSSPADNPVEMSGAIITATQLLLQEKNAIRIGLMQAFLAVHSRTELKLMVSQYQAFFTRLIDQVTSQYARLAPGKVSLQQPYTDASRNLHDILLYIEQQYARYLDLDQKVPDSQRIATQKEVADAIPEIKAMLKRNQQDQSLNQLVLNFLIDFSQNRFTEDVTYRKARYISLLVSELKRLGTLSREHCIFSALKELLFYLNFNCLPYLNYTINSFEASAAALPSAPEKIAFLTRQYKEIKTMHTRPGIAFDHEMPSVQQQLVFWLKGEMFLLKSDVPEVFTPAGMQQLKKLQLKWAAELTGANDLMVSLGETGAILIDGKPATITEIAELFNTVFDESVDIYKLDYTNSQRKKELSPFLVRLLNSLKLRNDRLGR